MLGGGPDRSLVRAIAQAHAWRRDWTSEGGPSFTMLARRDDADLSYVLRLARLAYLAPDLARSALAGNGDGIAHGRSRDPCRLAFDWGEQRRLFLAAQ